MALGTLCLVYAFFGYPFRRRMSSNKFCFFVVVISEEER